MNWGFELYVAVLGILVVAIWWMSILRILLVRKERIERHRAGMATIEARGQKASYGASIGLGRRPTRSDYTPIPVAESDSLSEGIIIGSLFQDSQDTLSAGAIGSCDPAFSGFGGGDSAGGGASSDWSSSDDSGSSSCDTSSSDSGSCDSGSSGDF